ncbi:hypothetical protein DES38_11810 [Streptohalobacillus salinus]|uniref:Uncharacterized protein n=1 Tax=Streptohalobacillus salinus TaxID=621096 RepID=A0A2V3W0W6_9BACI|nr:hypothetical protein DES38_11810 [Streptohalobacillus salinus]
MEVMAEIVQMLGLITERIVKKVRLKNFKHLSRIRDKCNHMKNKGDNNHGRCITIN